MMSFIQQFYQDCLVKFALMGIRPYKSENLYKQLEEREKLKKEVRYLEEKAAGQQSRAEGGA